jgi:hypothetical protein
MTAENSIAKQLAEALGPLYRVQLIGPDDEVEETFGGFEGVWARRAVLELPGWGSRIALDVDAAMVEAAGRLARALLGATSNELTKMPPGTFTHVDRALEGLIAAAEEQVGRPVAGMSRADKQRVVRFLDERGVFALRKAVETVADTLGVSRFTVYNYLDATRED